MPQRTIQAEEEAGFVTKDNACLFVLTIVSLIQWLFSVVSWMFIEYCSNILHVTFSMYSAARNQ